MDGWMNGWKKVGMTNGKNYIAPAPPPPQHTHTHTHNIHTQTHTPILGPFCRILCINGLTLKVSSKIAVFFFCCFSEN